MPKIPDNLNTESLLPNETPEEVNPSLLPEEVNPSLLPYDPHVHRGTETGPTNLETLIHLVKGCLGLGILAMPNAYMHAGLVVGTVALVFIGFLCAYGFYILISTQYLMCIILRKPLLDYRQSMEVSLRNGPFPLKYVSRFGGALVDIFLVIFQFGLCLVYTIYFAAAIKQVVDHYSDIGLTTRHYILMLLIPFILLNWITNLRILAPFSLLANLLIFTSLIISLYYVFQDLPPISERRLTGKPFDFAFFVGTSLFALHAVGVVITLENTMRNPAAFVGIAGVLNQGIAFAVILYFIVGFFGYWKYGDETMDSITLNLPQNDILAQITKILYGIAMFFSHPLQHFPAFDIIWRNCFEEKFKGHSRTRILFYKIIQRTITVVIITLLACAYPELGKAISFIGSFCLSMVGICFPAVIQFCVLYPDNYGRFYWKLLQDIIIFTIGILAFVIGVSNSIFNL